MTGTDTGVGKTAVACGLILALRRRGVDVGAVKPVETGHTGTGLPPDARALSEAAGLSVAPRHLVPYSLRASAAPLVAAEAEGMTIDLTLLDDAVERSRRTHDLTFVEGAGGLAVPVTKEFLMADLAARWDVPILLVARAGLGTINHTVLSVEYARARGLRILGIILNGASERPDLAQRTNPRLLEHMTGVDVLGVVPHLDSVDVGRALIEPLGAAVARHVELEPFLRLSRGEIVAGPTPRSA